MSKREDRKAEDKLLRQMWSEPCGIAAMMAAETEKLGKQKDERDTEFVKRIAVAYNKALFTLYLHNNAPNKETK